MERIGIIDLGSNSVRLVIIDIDDKGAHHQIENLKETVRLAAGIDEEGALSSEAIDYAVETIKLFANFCKARRVDRIIAVATAAVRQAVNRQQLVDKLKTATGISFRVLSGEEEAHLGYLGVVNTIFYTDGLMADLGGGSLKLVSFCDRIKENALSEDFGVVTLTNYYDLADKPSPDNISKLEKFLQDRFGSVPWLTGKEPMIGLGGTFRSLARVIRKRKGYLPDITDGLELSLKDIEDVYQMLAGMSLEQRTRVPGMERARADISVAGTAVIYHLFKASERSKLITSTSGIRDGLLYEYLNRYTKDPIVLSVLTHNIDNLIRYYRLEENHLRRVSNLAVTFFDQLSAIHQMGAYERRLLLVASLLHEIGVVVSVEARDKHTLYMLMNTRLHGLTHRERIIVAYVAASHDGLYLVNIDDYINKGPLKESDVDLIKRLSAILQIIHSLDRCHTGVVTQVMSSIKQDSCTLQVLAKAGAELEINDAKRRAKSFEETFQHKLDIRQK